ncbi:MAG: M23/M56 family metallopeptidase [Syntrophomonadaceae bacterium]|nr:M23/M56 family metallopeptidase [Syntrophomonadaceae bacterium]
MSEWILTLMIPLTLTGSIAALTLWLVDRATKNRIDHQSPLLSVTIVVLLFLIPIPITSIKKLIHMIQNVLFIFTTQTATNQPVSGISSSEEVLTHDALIGNGMLFPVSDLFWICTKVLVTIWLVGVILFFTWNTWRYLRFYRTLRHNSTLSSDKEIRRAYEKANSAIHLSKSVPVYESNIIKTPMTVGILRPAIYLPKKLPAEDQLIYIFRHELAHIKYGHVLLKLIAQLAAILHWFNPVIWNIQHKLACACEFACDAKATSGFSENECKAYGFTLLDMLEAASVKTPYIVSTFGDSKEQVRHRLQLLFAPKESKKRICAAFLMLAILFISTGSVTAYASQNAVESISWAANLLSKSAQEPELFFISLSENTERDISQEELAALSSMHWKWPVPDYRHLIRKPAQFEQNDFDLSASTGTNIVAAEDGMVIAASSGRNSTDEAEKVYGTYLIIAHNGEPAVTTMYAHCDTLYVKEGDMVKAGQKIAAVGNSGNSTGPHCHFELRINGTAVDPNTIYAVKTK